MRKKKWYRSRGMWLAACAFALIFAASMERTLAYFTAYTEAKGGHVLTLGASSDIWEEYEDKVKQIRIENTGDTDCYVRVKVFSGEQVAFSCSGDGWEKKEDGYWYYPAILPAGERTDILAVAVHIPEKLHGSCQSFHVAVIQECTPVSWRDKEPFADWDLAVKQDHVYDVQEGGKA